jgi:hypothetical protein
VYRLKESHIKRYVYTNNRRIHHHQYGTHAGTRSYNIATVTMGMQTWSTSWLLVS